MNIKHEQFIGIYENAFSKEYCDKAISYFEDMVQAGYGFNRQQENSNVTKLQKDDLIIYAHAMISMPISMDLQIELNKILWEKCYAAYANDFSILKLFSPHSNYSFKIQKTEPGQGYHQWHCESMGREICGRILAWSLYLNDVEDGGETEFIYQRMRIKPKTGTFLMWPAGFTHTHRGNPPLSGAKYIVTGWIEF